MCLLNKTIFRHINHENNWKACQSIFISKVFRTQFTRTKRNVNFDSWLTVCFFFRLLG